jgi:repressor of nif and glnA expression
MKRDWEVIRAILLALEALGDTNSVVSAGDIKGYDAETVNYHMRMLIEKGLIEGECSEPLGGGLYCLPERLTWEGHEFLDNMRDQAMWNRVKSTIREKGIGLSFEAIKLAGKLVVQRMLS